MAKCPKCGSLLSIEKDSYGEYQECILGCGYTKDIQPPVARQNKWIEYLKQTNKTGQEAMMQFEG